MDLLDQPYFAMLRSRLDHLGHRQKLIAENIANASTPGYKGRDVDMAAFDRMAQAHLNSGDGPVALSATHSAHMPAGGRTGRLSSAGDSETTLDRNSVVLEDQMVRAAETRSSYETSLALYQKGLQLLRMAARPPGR